MKNDCTLISSITGKPVDAPRTEEDKLAFRMADLGGWREQTIRAVFVDATEKTVSEWVFSGVWRDIPGKIGCSCFDVVRDPLLGCDIYIDDEGLYGAKNFVGFPGVPFLLAGNCVLLGGEDEKGNTLPCPLAPERVERLIRFITYDENKDAPQPFMKVLPL